MKKEVSAILFLLLFFVQGACAARRADDQEGDNDFLLRAMVTLESSYLNAMDLKRLHGLTKGEDETLRIRAVALYSHYLDDFQEKPFDALNLLAPYVLRKDNREEWIRELRRTGYDKDRPSETPFPEASQWELKYPECCIAVSRVLGSLGKHRASMAGYDHVGRNLHGLPRILAAEGGGNALVKLQRYPQAIEFYDYALTVADELRQDTGSQMAPDTRRDSIIDRIRRERAHAQKQWDIERYGLGFVSYRDAREYQFRKEYVKAAVVYQRNIMQFPETVYSEASTFYRAQCLLELSKKELADRAATRIREEEKRLDDLKSAYRKAGRLISKTTRGDLMDTLKDQEELVKEMKAVPIGRRALAQAIKTIDEKAKENQYGLYRGEGLICLATYFLEELLDISSASKYFNKAQDWFESVVKVDVDLEKFRVPGKAIEVSAPPPNERFVDTWNNIRFSSIKPGDIVNRHTCQWYIMSQRRIASLHLGFIAYVQNDSAAAEKHWKHMFVVDPYFRYAEGKGLGSTYSRLMWNIENNRGALYATPQEMKAFRCPKKRLIVMLGDLAYENGDPQNAKRFYDNLITEKYGALSKSEKAYVTFATGACLSYLHANGEGLRYLEARRDSFSGTPTEPRALMGIANLKFSADEMSESIRDYEQLRQRCPGSAQAERSFLYCGLAYEKMGKKRQAVRSLREYVKRDRASSLAEYAKMLIMNLEDELKEG